MAEKKEYRVRVCGVLVPVTQEVYQVFYQTKRHAKTLYEKDERNGLISYDGMDTEDTLGEEMIRCQAEHRPYKRVLRVLPSSGLRYAGPVGKGSCGTPASMEKNAGSVQNASPLQLRLPMKSWWQKRRIC